SIQETAKLFGQTIFFWVMTTSLLAYTIQKQGLAKRYALFFLSIPGVASSTYRLLFFYMLVTGFLSWFVSDASTIALMMPLGLSLQSCIRTLTRPAVNEAGADALVALPVDVPPQSLVATATVAAPSGVQPLALDKAQSPLASFFALGTLYAAVAGGVATIAGAPHNAVAIAQLEAVADVTLGWFSWMMVGVPIFFTVLVLSYLLLLLFFKPEIRDIPGVREFLREERKKLGRMTLGEKNVLVVFLVTVSLFTLPPVLPTLLGDQHPFSQWLDNVMSIWLVAPIVLILLFSLPTDLRKGELLLNWKEAAARTPWHILLMVTSAVGMTDALADFGFMDIVTNSIKGANLSAAALPFFAGVVTSVSTNFISGVAATSVYTSMLIPVAQHIGLNPASIAIIVPCAAVGLTFPWAGPTVATAFGFGEISLRDLIRVGILAQVIMVTVAATYCLIFAPIL
ncbi:MAG: anion permease, partial [Acidobacteria bacterium]|nr:anion permease [Acidobacteriota bacterium]